jgi:hypothetical protein
MYSNFEAKKFMAFSFRIKKSTMLYLAFLFAVELCFGQTTNLSRQIIGEWRNVTLKITFDSLNNAGPKKILEANENSWEQVLNIEPIRTHFLSNHTYYSEYRNTKDSLVRMPKGTWSIKGEEITMHQTAPDEAVYVMRLKITGDLAEFKGMIDFDGNGKADDYYYGTQRKQPN